MSITQLIVCGSGQYECVVTDSPRTIRVVMLFLDKKIHNKIIPLLNYSEHILYFICSNFNRLHHKTVVFIVDFYKLLIYDVLERVIAMRVRSCSHSVFSKSIHK